MFCYAASVHVLWVQRSELFCPVAFPSSQAFVKASHDLKDCNPEIVQGMAWAVEMASYWFLCPLVYDVIVMSVEADVEGVLYLPNVYCFWHFLHSIELITFLVL